MKKFLSVLLAIMMIATSALVLTASAAEPAQSTKKVSVLGKTADGAWETMDLTWWEADKKATEYTISTAAQFLGFRYIVNEQWDKFEGKTVKLDADIVINVGDASTWTAETKGLFVWDRPIGITGTGKNVSKDDAATCEGAYFGGTFDGQGHVISGIYGLRARDNGLFGQVVRGTVKNFILANSVFINNNTGSHSSGKSGARQGVGSVCDRLSGTIDNVISYAYVSGGFAAGGLVGYMQTNASITNSVFAGTIDLTDCASAGGGLYGADDYSMIKKVENCAFTGKMILNKLYANLGDTEPSNNLSADIGMISGTNKSGNLNNIVVAAALEGDRDMTNFSYTTKFNANSTQDPSGAYTSQKANLAMRNIWVIKVDEKIPAGTVIDLVKYYDSKKVPDPADASKTISVGYVTPDQLPAACNTVSNVVEVAKASNMTAASFSGMTAANWNVPADGKAVPASINTMVAAMSPLSTFTGATHPLWTPPAKDDGGDENDDPVFDWSDMLGDKKDDDKKEETTTAAPAADDGEKKDEKKGCGSMIATGALLVTVSALGLGYVATKKKED